jgi:ribonucleoside-diphosphate reductase alpha chain|uniref:ribonucleoside-diphosphate reductase n=1 Tax=viral metagenome TaxID=1070528 RepID=A0A6C0BFJ9_9ZZZZ
MRVIKRTGTVENVSFDKVLNRIKNLSSDLSIDVYDISQKVCSRIFDNVRTSQLDELAAHICSSLIIEHPDYGVMASRIIISNHQKNTSPSFSETIQLMYDNVSSDGERNSLVSEELYQIVMKNKEKLNNYIDYSRDFLFDYFGFKTLERSYLLKIGGKVIERPQHMLMRVALGVHGDDIKDALQTYDYMSKKYFVHATPTLFNAGTPRAQCSSCFLLANNEDSISGIYSSLGECAQISKYAGGIGLHIHDVRARGSKIRGTNGTSTGIIPMLRVFNNTARYVNQSGKRNGSIAVYLEPWHADIEGFLELRKNHGNEEERTRDLFLALWIPDLFMERVKENGVWSMMCPDQCKGLSDVYGEEFVKLYTQYEAEGKYVKQVNAQDLWFKILESQIETGTPYLLYKDAANTKSNQKNLGTIKSSNLCSEIVEYSSPDEIAVCNLASICLPTYVEYDTNGVPFYNFDKLHEIAKIITKNLNKVIDINFYPVEKARVSNLKHRPIGIGIQGLADTFALMKLAFESDAALKLNSEIFATIYHGALESSMEIAKKRHEFASELRSAGNDMTQERTNELKSYMKYTDYDPQYESEYPGAYLTFKGSPASQGLLQFDLWNATPSKRYDWDGLKNDIVKYGLRNSLLVAPMPTASTSQIMGFNESFEAFTSNMYKRKTLAGEFVVINKYLINDLIAKNLWNKTIRDKIIIGDGSIQHIENIPEDIKALYKTVWEIRQKHVIDHSAARGIYVCQSQSMNLYMEDPDFKKLTSMHFYAWGKGLKTGVYYLRSKPRASTQKFTIEPVSSINSQDKKKVVCTDEVCLVCSS